MSKEGSEVWMASVCNSPKDSRRIALLNKHSSLSIHAHGIILFSVCENYRVLLILNAMKEQWRERE